MLTKVFQTKDTNGWQVNKWYKVTFVNITNGANKCFDELCPICYSKQEAFHKRKCVHTWCGIGNVENIIHVAFNSPLTRIVKISIPRYQVAFQHRT